MSVKTADCVPVPVVATTCPVVEPGMTSARVVSAALDIIIAEVPLIVTFVVFERSKFVAVIVKSVPTGPLVGLIEMLGELPPAASLPADDLQ